MKYSPLTPEEGRQLLIKHGHIPVITKNTEEDFLRACKDGKIAVVRGYLAIGMPPNIHAKPNRETPLIRATEGKHLDLIDLLLENGADLEGLDSWGDTALLTAVNWKHLEVVKHLIKKGANLHMVSAKKWIPLARAIKDGQGAIVDLLLAGGANPDYTGENGVAAIFFAISHNSTFYLDKLIQAGAKLDYTYDNHGLSLVTNSILNDRLEVANRLLKGGANPHHVSTYGWTAWMAAAHKQLVTITQRLEETYGVEKGDISRVAFIEAAGNGNRELVEAYIAEGKDVNLAMPRGLTALMNAAKKGDTRIIRLLVEKGANVNALDESDWSALCYACNRKYIECVKILLDAGADPNEKDNHSRALIQSTRQNSATLVKMLLEAGAYVDSQDSYQQTPLLLSVDKGFKDIFDVLLEAGADVDIPNNNGSTPLHLCAFNGRFDQVAWLIEAGAKLDVQDKNGRTPLFRACDKYKNTNKKYGAMVLQLLEAGADYTIVDKYNYSPLEEARNSKNTPCEDELSLFLTWEQIERVKAKPELLEQGSKAVFDAFAKTQNYDTLMEWVRWGEYEIVEGLLHSGISPNPTSLRTKHPLQIAAKEGNWSMLTLLLQHGADPNHVLTYDTIPFAQAVATADAEIIQLFLDYGANVHHKNYWHSSAMNEAAREGNVEVLDMLYTAGAKVDPNPAGTSPLYLAVMKKQKEAVIWLLSKGADPNIVTTQMRSPLVVAIDEKSPELARILLDAGANVNHIYKGQSLLVIATVKGQLDTVKLLLEFGADPYLEDLHGKTAFDYAGHRQKVLEALNKFAKTNRIAGQRAVRRITGDTPALIEAIYEKNYARVTELIEGGADINVTNYRGDSALMVAIARNHTGMISTLINKGANIEHTNTMGDNAWTFSALYSTNDISAMIERVGGINLQMKHINQQADLMSRVLDAKDLIKKGEIEKVVSLFDLKKLDIHLWPNAVVPMVLALTNSDTPMVRMLLGKGANPNIPNAQGILALHYALRMGDYSLIKTLLENGADVNRRDFSGLNAKELADQSGSGSIRDLIRKYSR